MFVFTYLCVNDWNFHSPWFSGLWQMCVFWSLSIYLFISSGIHKYLDLLTTVIYCASLASTMSFGLCPTYWRWNSTKKRHTSNERIFLFYRGAHSDKDIVRRLPLTVRGLYALDRLWLLHDYVKILWCYPYQSERAILLVNTATDKSAFQKVDLM